jgi:KEOPS complex subunit Pcc1
MSDPTARADGSTLDGEDSEHTLSVSFEYDSERRARIVAGSVAPEADEIPDDRSRARVDRDGSAVGVDIAAADLVALRAGANTWLRLVDVAETVTAAAEDNHGVGNEPPRSDDDRGSSA